MEKNKIHFRFLKGILFLFAFTSELFTAQISYSELKEKYFLLQDLKKALPELSLEEDTSTFIITIRTPKGQIRTRMDSDFYNIHGRVERMNEPILKKKKKLLIGADLAEAILIHLAVNEYTYNFTESGLSFEKKEKKTKFPERLNIQFIILDAGHGGKDPGTSSQEGVEEKKIALRTALEIRKSLLQKFPGIKVFMTRDKDEFIELSDRSKKANRILRKEKKGVFISLHCNSSLNAEPSGFEVYFLSQTPTSETARETALIENRIVPGNGDPGVKKIQSAMMSSLIQRRSRKLADFTETHMSKELGEKILSRGVKKADFAVLRGSLMPALLIEMGYLSNQKEAKLLAREKIHRKISKGIINGIIAYGKSRD